MTLSLVCYDTLRYAKSISALKKTLECVEADKVYWFSDKPLDEDLGVPVIWTEIEPINKSSMNWDIGDLCFKKIPAVVDTDHALYVQSDGFAINKEAWTDEFLQYDYIGAPWPFRLAEGLPCVGNGGFSLRSRKLHEALLKLNVPQRMWIMLPEDTLIGITYRRELEDKGIKFAPIEAASRFSMETAFGDERDAWVGKSFGFHGGFLCQYYGYEFEELI